MSRDQSAYLEDMLTACDRVIEYTAGLDAEALCGSRMAFDAVVRNLEVLGEVAKRVSLESRAKAPEIPWREICGMRDVLIHDYFGVDVEVVCEAALSEVPTLRPRLAALLAELASASVGP